MLLEGILDATSSSKIVFRIHDDAEGYQQILFENGAFVIQCKPDRFWTNVGDIANVKIEKILPSTGKKFFPRFFHHGYRSPNGPQEKSP